MSLDAPRTIGHLAFDDTNTGTAGSWTLAGPETLTLAGTSPSITVGSLGTGASATIATTITGSDGVTRAGNGTLTLTGSNSYTGGTTVNAGALKGTIDSICGDVQVASGATVQFNATETGEISNIIAGEGVLRLHLGSGVHTIMNNLGGVKGLIWVSNTGIPVTNKWSVTNSVSADAAVLLDPGSTIFVLGGQTASFSKGITLSG